MGSQSLISEAAPIKKKKKRIEENEKNQWEHFGELFPVFLQLNAIEVSLTRSKVRAQKEGKLLGTPEVL